MKKLKEIGLNLLKVVLGLAGVTVLAIAVKYLVLLVIWA
jgi:hypothetical protein